MDSPEEDGELGALADIYDLLKGDAKQIVVDLEGGVAMWREAAAGAFASAGFLVILAFTSFNPSSGNPLNFWGTVGRDLYLVLAAVLTVTMLGFGVYGFRKYYQLRRKYAGLFSRAAKLV